MCEFLSLDRDQKDKSEEKMSLQLHMKDLGNSLKFLRGQQTVVFNISVSSMDRGTEHILIKFAAKLCGMADMLGGRAVIQRDLGTLERWACANLMEYKANCKVLHLGPKYRLGREWIESRSEKKDLGDVS